MEISDRLNLPLTDYEFLESIGIRPDELSLEEVEERATKAWQEVTAIFTDEAFNELHDASGREESPAVASAILLKYCPSLALVLGLYPDLMQEMVLFRDVFYTYCLARGWLGKSG